MKRWNKYKLFRNSDSIVGTTQDFDGYVSTGSLNKKDFFCNNFYNYSEGLSRQDKVLKQYLQRNKIDLNRLKHYDKILRGYLQKGRKILSIGSGKSINELLLIESGYDITCSDIKQYYNEEVLRLFPDLKFINLNICSPEVLNGKYDFVISLGVFFLFDDRELSSIFRNIGTMLNKGGKMIFDFGGAEKNFFTLLIDEFFVKYEARARCIIGRLRGKDCVVKSFFNGYRRTNQEIISLAEKKGFKFLDIITADYNTEITRSIFLTKIADFKSPFRNIAYKIGRHAPYVRMFVFEFR